jgi:hypothetical protein
MLMSNLAILEKFETIEITNESRISSEELEYCMAQQAYLKRSQGERFMTSTK